MSALQEEQYVATLVENPELLARVNLIPADFQNASVSRIFQTVIALLNDNRTPDVIAVAEALGDDWLKQVHDVFIVSTAPANFDATQDQIKADSRVRQLKATGSRFILEINQILE